MPVAAGVRMSASVEAEVVPILSVNCGILHRASLAQSRSYGVEERGGFKMSIEPAGWHMDPGPPSWDPEAKTFSFFLNKRDQESVLCTAAMDAMEDAARETMHA